jgi:hypothetical protein
MMMRCPKSILFALGLALWEWIFYFYSGNGPFGWFAPERLGFDLAWLAFIYLAFQLVSIPFALRAGSAVDGMASLLPLAITLIVIFGKPEFLNTAERWEAATLLLCLAATDLFGGYLINLALSRLFLPAFGRTKG